MAANTLSFAYHRLRQRTFVLISCLFLKGFEHIFVDLAQGAYPVIRNVLKGGSRSDTAVWVAFFGIVHVLAHGADIFLHLFVFYLR
jgi:hypothetical protein